MFSVNPDLTSNLYITKPGTTPLVTKSEKESNSFQMHFPFLVNEQRNHLHNQIKRQEGKK